jgi:hypothetical protein
MEFYIILGIVLVIVIWLAAKYRVMKENHDRLTVKYHARVTGQLTDEELDIRDSIASEIRENRKNNRSKNV